MIFIKILFRGHLYKSLKKLSLIYQGSTDVISQTISPIYLVPSHGALVPHKCCSPIDLMFLLPRWHRCFNPPCFVASRNQKIAAGEVI